MEIQLSEENGYKVVSIEGEMDLYSAPQLRIKAGEFLEMGPVNVIIELSKVFYIDSSGLATLIEFRQRIKASQGEVFLVGMSDKLMNLFKITKFDKLFKIYKNKSELFALD